MKNLIKRFLPLLVILIIISTSFISCKDDERVLISKIEYERLKNTQTSKYPKPFELFDDALEINGAGIVLDSDNHEYLEIQKNSSSNVVIHYVDCELCMSRNPSCPETKNNVVDTTKTHQ